MGKTGGGHIFAFTPSPLILNGVKKNFEHCRHCLCYIVLVSSNIFLDTRNRDVIKVIDISCPVLWKIEYQGLSGIHTFSGNSYISSFFPQRREKALENIVEVSGISWDICKFRDEWNGGRRHSQRNWTLFIKIYEIIISEWSMYAYVKIWKREEKTRFAYATIVSRNLEITYQKSRLCSNNVQLC